VPAYQPETAYRIFSRAIFGYDIATGTIATASPAHANYSTTGPSSSWYIKQQPPHEPQVPYQCYVLALDTCTAEQIEGIRNGSALLHDYILIDANQTGSLPGPNATGTPSGATSSARDGTLLPSGVGSVRAALAWLLTLALWVLLL
jgi:hypothetical protein